MSNQQNQTPQGKMFSALVVGAVAFAAWDHFGPVMQESGEINDEAALAVAIFAICVLSFTIGSFSLLADFLELVVAKSPKGNKGSAGWASWRSLRRDVLRDGFGPYWGVYAGKGRGRGQMICADYSSNALTVGTAGSGKGVGVVLPTCMAIRESKFIPDFKGTNSCMLHAPLTERGEVFRMLNIGGMHLDRLGEGDCYNPLSVILADNFKRAGGLADVSSDAEEMSLQLYPEPTSGGEDKFWRDGTRDFMGFSMQQCVLVNGDAATLGDVCQLLGDRERLLKESLWAAGRLEGEDGTLPAMPLESSPWGSRHAPQDVENYIAYYRAKAGSIADLLVATDSKTADSFLTGARQAFSPFNITTRAAKVMSKSTFRFGDMKEGANATTVSIIIDASRLATQSKISALLQWCAMTEWKRHNNKHRPVYVIHDETTNGKINDLPSLQTWGREYGIKWHGFIQSLAAYEVVYGKQAVSTLLSETEIKQFLPNQRDPDTLALIEKLLGEQSIVTKNHNGNRDRFGISGFAYQEEAKPLMRAEEIRRTDNTILFIRNNRPIQTTLPSIAEIAPWRKQIGINPYHKKPYLKRVTLRIGNRKGGMLQRLFRWLSRS